MGDPAAADVCGISGRCRSGLIRSDVSGDLQNPLVSPDLLGVSAGACVGASIAILCQMPSGMIQLLAFGGGIAAVGLTNLVPVFFP